MSVGRTIVALLIAISVAMLPAAGGARVSAIPVDGHSASAMENMDAPSDPSADMSAMEQMDCCPHKANPCDDGMGGCSSMATCALKCFSFSATSFSDVVFPSLLLNVIPSFVSIPFNLQTGTPPFRPPRV